MPLKYNNTCNLLCTVVVPALIKQNSNCCLMLVCHWVMHVANCYCRQPLPGSLQSAAGKMLLAQCYTVWKTIVRYLSFPESRKPVQSTPPFTVAFILLSVLLILLRSASIPVEPHETPWLFSCAGWFAQDDWTQRSLSSFLFFNADFGDLWCT